MARLRVMRRSARADFDKKWKQNVLGCANLAIANKGYCLAERQMPLIKERYLCIKWVRLSNS